MTGKINTAPEFCFNWIIGTPGYKANISLPCDILKCYAYTNQPPIQCTVSAPATPYYLCTTLDQKGGKLQGTSSGTRNSTWS